MHNQVPLHACLTSSISYQPWRLIPLDEFSFYYDSEISDEVSNPDILMVRDSEDSGMESVLAVEVWLSQTSADLEKRVRYLIQMNRVKVAMLFDIKETPNYKNPLRTEENKKIYHSERIANPGNSTVLIRQYCKGRTPYSPVFLYGVRWMGELTAAVQVFGKDTATGEAVARTPRVTFFGHPKASSREPFDYEPYFSLNTSLSDCVQSDDERYHKELVLNWDILRFELERARRGLASLRYTTAARGLAINEKL